MAKFSGLLYVKHGRVGSRSEGPDYYLQTARGEYLVRDAERLPWQPDYRLEFFNRRMVEIDGSLAEAATIRVAEIRALQVPTIPRREAGDGWLGASVDIPLGQRVQIGDEPVTLRFAAVVADSRRSGGAQSAPVGRCTVRLELVPEGGEAARFDMSSDPDAPELAVAEVLGYHVTLHDVTPHPTADAPRPAPDRCTATVLIDRLE